MVKAVNHVNTDAVDVSHVNTDVVDASTDAVDVNVVMDVNTKSTPVRQSVDLTSATRFLV